MTGPDLRSIRESFGMDQAEFAAAVGLAGAWANVTISKMERGIRPVNPLVARCAELMVENRRLRGRSHKRQK